jgi:flavodoxin
MYQVIVYSRSGNTRKVADALAGELGVRATDVAAAALDPNAKIVFLGSGRYGGLPGPEMLRFIEANDFKGRKVAFFGTYWIAGLNAKREEDATTQALQKKGATVLGSYRCSGKSLRVFKPGHPDKEELDGAKKFAREMIRLAG